MRPTLEVADIVRAHGDEFRRAHAETLSVGQKRVLRAIERCRTAALGGHLERCDQCGHERNAYNSCVMGSNSLWGVLRGNRRKSNHSKPLFLPIKNLGLPKAGSSRGPDLS